MNRRLIVAAGIFIAAVIAVSGAYFYNYKYRRMEGQNAPSPNHAAPQDSTGGNSYGGNRNEGTMRGFTAPRFELQDLEGRTVKLEDYADKIVFVNFWTSWCGACKEELSIWAEENREIAQDSDVAIISINVGESREKIKEFMDNNGINISVLADDRQSVAEKYGISAFPTTFVLDRGGVVYDICTTKLSGSEIHGYINRIKNKE